MVVLKPNVVRGGRAIGLGNNLYLMKGRTHSKGGIDIGKNPKTGLEVENNEVMQVSPQGVRVFSAQPILGGISPAQYILGGANPNQVFNAQEQWKKINRINDDGTKYRKGGKIDKKRFRTILTDKNEKEFVNWYKNVSSILGLNEDPDNPNHHYDYRGYWLENKNNNIDYTTEGFHFPDTYKQPTHPTFSIESQYAKRKYGINPKEVGHWEGENFIPGLYNNIINFKYKSDLEKQKNYAEQEYAPSEDIINYIKGIEGFRSEWYKDGNGIDTIGYGFTGKDAKAKFANGITKEQADKYFADTLAQKVKILQRDTPNWDKLNQNQRDALLSYHYNIGEGSYRNKSPKMQQALKDEDWETVVANIDYGYNDKKNPGLKKRRDYERNLFNTPVEYKYGGRQKLTFGKYQVSRYEDKPVEEEKIYTDNISPSVITAKLPEKFKGSKVAANRYAEAYKFGKKVIEKRDNEFRKTAPIVFGLPILGGIGGAELVAGLATAPVSTALGTITGSSGAKIGEKIGGTKGAIIGGLLGSVPGAAIGSVGDFAIKDGLKYAGRNFKKYIKLFNYGLKNSAEIIDSGSKYIQNKSDITSELRPKMYEVGKEMASLNGLTKKEKRIIAKKIESAIYTTNPNYKRTIDDFNLKFKKYAKTPELKKIFKENPEYLRFIDETKLDPLKQETIDSFVERQSSAIRGIHAKDEDIIPFLTESKYMDKLDYILGKKRGGDRLGTRGGVYTSNRFAIADAFRRPVSEKEALSNSEKSVIGELEFPIKYDKTKSIKNQLRDIRKNTLNKDDYDWLRFHNEDTYNSGITKSAIDKGINNFESQYTRATGEKVDAFEKVTIGDYNLNLKSKQTSSILSNMKGRWAQNGVDEFPIDKRFFIPKSTTKADIKTMIDLIGRKSFDENAMWKYNNIFDSQINKFNNIVLNSTPYKVGNKIKRISNNSKTLRYIIKNDILNKDFLLPVGITGLSIGGIVKGIKYDTKLREEFSKTDKYKEIYDKYKNRTSLDNFNNNHEDAIKALEELDDEISKEYKKYKKDRLKFKYGGIHIKPSKRGTFTAAAKKHGMSVQGFASKVLANKGKYSSAMVKKANFARNASKWKHKEFGGDMDFNYWITKDNIYKLGGRKKGQWGLQDYSNSFKVNLQPFNPSPITSTNVNNGLSLGIPNLIGAGLNLAGNVASYFVNRRALKSMQPPVAPSAPTPLRAENLETRVSTAAQEAALRENIAKQENLIAGNLSSSRSRLNAVNAVRNQGIGLYNQLQERKQNVQTELINRAKLNRQQINSQNTLLANQYKDKVTNWRNSVIDFENKRKDALSENAIQHLIQGPIDAITGERGFFANLQNNDRYRMTAFLQAITSPDALKAMNSNEIRQLAQKFGVRTSWLRSIGINV